jgi:hypothetical protein
LAPLARVPVARLPVARLPVDRLPVARPPAALVPVERFVRPLPDELPELDLEPLLLACGIPYSFVSVGRAHP